MRAIKGVADKRAKFRMAAITKLRGKMRRLWMIFMTIRTPGRIVNRFRRCPDRTHRTNDYVRRRPYAGSVTALAIKIATDGRSDV